MVNGERRITEIIVWALVIVSLIILILLVTGFSSASYSNKGTTNTITNSYNTNTYPSVSPSSISYLQDSSHVFPPRSSSYSYSKPHIVQDRYPDRARVYYVRNDLRYTKSYDQYLRYDDWGRRNVVRGILGNDIDKYEVYVRNREYTGGYFKVNFYFEDYYGRIRTESTSRYISPRGESRFVFKDISREKYKYPYWSYRVTSHTKAPTRIYYNTDSPRTIYAR